MADPRLARLGELIVGYSLGLEAGKVLRVDTPVAGLPLALEFYRAALRTGAFPYLNVEVADRPEIRVAEGSDEQLDFLPPVAMQEVEVVDAIATIWAEANTRSLSGAAPERHQRLIAAARNVTNRRWERISAGELSWSGVLCPTPAHAQDAEMSVSDYESFVFRACHVEDEGDAVAHWQSTSADLQARAEQLGQVRELRIVAPDTDLRIV